MEEIRERLQQLVDGGVPGSRIEELAAKYDELPWWRFIKRGRAAERIHVYSEAAIWSTFAAIEARNRG